MHCGQINGLKIRLCLNIFHFLLQEIYFLPPTIFFHSYNDFIICLGYKGHMIKEYFLNYYLYNSDVTIELEKNKVDVHFSHTESFKVTLIDTGIDTNTAGRIKRIQKDRKSVV